MIDILVQIYRNKELKVCLDSYRLDFAATPRVGDFIAKHVGIEGSSDCYVERVVFIPKLNNSGDADVFLKCVQTEIDPNRL
ncbi:MAG: hypothetical protein KME38_20640 [Spirirestis rafaelensis WJT71-NPBG6]|jgi:hypothetical protein|nr:hypothetical protein [Spirirestis rafaelensis WJT71-NPBG6]